MLQIKCLNYRPVQLGLLLPLLLCPFSRGLFLSISGQYTSNMENNGERKDAGFETWRVADLKKFLKEREQCVSGKKDDLVRRAQGCVSLGICKAIGAETSECGLGSVLHRRLTPLQTPTGQSMPHPDALQNWTDLGEFPADFGTS